MTRERVSGRLGSRNRRPGKAGRLRRLLAVAGGLLLAAWLVGCLLVVAEPTVNRPAPADAILVLGPPDVDGRVGLAYQLARQHYAGTVVISVESDEQLRAKSACRNDNPDYQVVCFQPDPKTTRGEAEEIGRLAESHHWHTILVVTSKYHVSRARVIVSRCVAGRVLVVAAPGKPSLLDWVYQFGYQTAGFVKVLLHPSC